MTSRSTPPDVCVQVTIPNEFKRRAPLMIGVTAGIEDGSGLSRVDHACNSEVDLVVVPSEHSGASFIVEYQGARRTEAQAREADLRRPRGRDTGVVHAEGAVFQRHPRRARDVPEKNFVFVGLGLDKPQGRDRKNVSSRLIEWFCRGLRRQPERRPRSSRPSIVNSSTIDFETVTRKRIEDIKKSTGCGEFPKLFLIHGRLEEYDLADLQRPPRPGLRQSHPR
jgi:hypothetical protein